ncbi:ABC transporter permease [Kitasatospora herbaricolor]|uniref:MFS transporter n=1 Tax=Kitasatospora herbaricolor TaxID=68217 RepID=UPI00174BA776|nr:MFS transporter [Kitasatospora herbaricolor]MDQ0311658.1 putative MFS family arabinose efflux permease [Kitasatospora herbaricolor]GGU95818.1 ABC transporter permease [Kitasatospora herbaricolor]
MAVVEKFRSAVGLTGRRVLLWSLLGRLPNAMCPIGTLLLVTGNTGSVWRGSAATGALAIGQGIGGPLVGRLADRRGQRPVGLTAAVVNTVAIVALVLASERDAPLGWQIAPAALVGMSMPLVGPLSRSRWVRLAGGRQELTSSMMSLDGIVDEISFTTGPALVGLLATLADPEAGLLLAAALVGVCATLFALHPSASPGEGARRVRSGEKLLTTPYVLLLAGMALLGACFGSLQVGVTASTAALGQPGAAGLLYAFLGFTSAFSGVATAALPSRLGLPLRLRAGTALLFAGSLLLLVAGGTTAALTAAIGCVGVAVAPQMITMFGLVERTVPAGRLGEAMAALVSSITLAQSAGTLAGGWAAERWGPGAPFEVTVLAAGAALLLAVLTATESRYRRRPEPAAPAGPTAEREPAAA